MDTVLPLYDDVQIPVQDHDEKTDLCGYVFDLYKLTYATLMTTLGVFFGQSYDYLNFRKHR